MKIKLIVFFVLLFNVAFSQNDKIYFDENWKITSSKEKALYYRTWDKISDSDYAVTDYFITGEKQMEAHSTAVEPLAKFGLVTFYSKNGNKTSEGNYKNDKAVGKWQWWDENKNLWKVGQYDEEGKLTGMWKGTFKNGSKYFEGNYVNGKMDGVWKWYFENGKLSSEETYDNGELKNIRQWEKDGQELKKNVEVKINPTFPGGEDALWEFIKKTMQYPDEAKNKDITGRVVVKMKIDTLGNLTNISIKDHANPLLDSEALRIVREMPKWIPGKEHNRTINFWWTLPINFKLKDYDYVVNYKGDTIRGEIIRLDYFTSKSFRLKELSGDKENYSCKEVKTVMYRGALYRAKPLEDGGEPKDLFRVLMKNGEYEVCRREWSRFDYFVFQGDSLIERMSIFNTKELLVKYFNNCAAFNNKVALELKVISHARLSELADEYYNFKCETKNDKE